MKKDKKIAVVSCSVGLFACIVVGLISAALLNALGEINETDCRESDVPGLTAELDALSPSEHFARVHCTAPGYLDDEIIIYARLDDSSTPPRYGTQRKIHCSILIAIAEEYVPKKYTVVIQIDSYKTRMRC